METSQSSSIQRALVTVMVEDLNRALEFYTSLLGFKQNERFENHWAEIEAPGLIIGLHPTHKPVAKGDNMQIGLRVDDIELFAKKLTDRGVEVTDNSESRVRLIHFRDPDGNMLYLTS